MKGHYGSYGGQFVPETLMHPLEELEQAYADARKDPSFENRLDELLHQYSGGQSPLFAVKILCEAFGRII